MRTLLTTALAALGAFAASGWTPSSRAARALAPDTAEAARLSDEIARLREDLAVTRRRLEGRAGSPTAAPAAPGTTIDEAEVAAAVERWRAAHPLPESETNGERSPGPRGPRLQAVDLPVDVAGMTIPEIVRLLDQNALDHDQQQQLFEELRATGRLDEYVAEIERLAAENPTDPALQVALGNAYLQKLFGVKGGMEAGTWAMKSDGAFGKALDLDPENWEARFLKAVSLSNWPAFLGKGREAIDHFEILVEQQESMAPRPEFAQTYLFYGNVLAASGDPDEALSIWRQGLRLYPDVVELREAVGNAEREND